MKADLVTTGWPVAGLRIDTWVGPTDMSEQAHKRPCEERSMKRQWFRGISAGRERDGFSTEFRCSVASWGLSVRHTGVNWRDGRDWWWS